MFGLLGCLPTNMFITISVLHTTLVHLLSVLPRIVKQKCMRCGGVVLD